MTCHSNCNEVACSTNSIVGGFEALGHLQCLLDCSDMTECVLPAVIDYKASFRKQSNNALYVK